MSEASVVLSFSYSDVRRNSLEGQLDAFKKTLDEAKKFILVLPALPRPVLKIRAPGKRLVKIDEGKIARLEYSTLLALLREKEPSIKTIAVTAGDYKATIGYLLFLYEQGLLAFSSSSTAYLAAQAHLSLSQKRYERIIRKIIDEKVLLNEDKFNALDKEEIPCIYYEGEILCRYLARKAPRSQLKAYVKAINSLLGSKKE